VANAPASTITRVKVVVMDEISGRKYIIKCRGNRATTSMKPGLLLLLLAETLASAFLAAIVIS